MKITLLLTLTIFILLSCKKHEYSESEKNVMINNDQHMSEKDKDFAEFAMSDCIYALTISKYAIQNSNDARVKAIAKLIVTIMTELHADLQNWAKSIEYILPNKMRDEQQNIADELYKIDGLAFDYAFVDLLVDTHKERLNKYKEERMSGENAFLKYFTIKNIPVLESTFINYEEGSKILK